MTYLGEGVILSYCPQIPYIKLILVFFIPNLLVSFLLVCNLFLCVCNILKSAFFLAKENDILQNLSLCVCHKYVFVDLFSESLTSVENIGYGAKLCP